MILTTTDTKKVNQMESLKQVLPAILDNLAHRHINGIVQIELRGQKNIRRSHHKDGNTS